MFLCNLVLIMRGKYRQTYIINMNVVTGVSYVNTLVRRVNSLMIVT